MAKLLLAHTLRTPAHTFLGTQRVHCIDSTFPDVVHDTGRVGVTGHTSGTVASVSVRHWKAYNTHLWAMTGTEAPAMRRMQSVSSLRSLSESICPEMMVVGVQAVCGRYRCAADAQEALVRRSTCGSKHPTSNARGEAPTLANKVYAPRDHDWGQNFSAYRTLQ